MTLATALLLAGSLGLNAWLLVFLFVLLHDRTELAPRRSGGGPSSSRWRPASTPTAKFPTPRKPAGA